MVLPGFQPLQGVALKFTIMRPRLDSAPWKLQHVWIGISKLQDNTSSQTMASTVRAGVQLHPGTSSRLCSAGALDFEFPAPPSACHPTPISWPAVAISFCG